MTKLQNIPLAAVMTKWRKKQNPGTEQTEATPNMKRANGGKTAEDWKSVAERINAEQGV